MGRGLSRIGVPAHGSDESSPCHCEHHEKTTSRGEAPLASVCPRMAAMSSGVRPRVSLQPAFAGRSSRPRQPLRRRLRTHST